MDFLRDMLNFSRKRTGAEAVLFFLFYLGCFALVSVVLKGEI